MILGFIIAVAYKAPNNTASPQDEVVQLSESNVTTGEILSEEDSTGETNPLVYTNTEYRFSMELPANWSGYKIFNDTTPTTGLVEDIKI